MENKTLSRACALMAVLVVLATTSWELYLRSTGFPLGYDDGKERWSDIRAKVYDSPDKTTVFIGSSRIKYDLDIDTWQKITGREAVQLAIEGSTPMPVLRDLGNDPNFHGRLVIDVTESLFFATSPPVRQKPEEYIAYFKKRTPAQKFSIVLDRVLESKLLFLDQDAFSLNAELNKWKLPNRSMFVFPTFPPDFGRMTVLRQEKMSPRFVADTALQHQVQNIWKFLMNSGRSKHGKDENPVPGILKDVQDAVTKIRSRGGDVVFVRTPDSAPMPGGEETVFPRAAMWNPLLATAQATGFYYKDNPATAHFVCPEWSHLTPADAVLYTQALINELPPSFAH